LYRVDKIKRMCYNFFEPVSGLDEEVVSQVVHRQALLFCGWSETSLTQRVKGATIMIDTVPVVSARKPETATPRYGSCAVSLFFCLAKIFSFSLDNREEMCYNTMENKVELFRSHRAALRARSITQYLCVLLLLEWGRFAALFSFTGGA